MDKISALMDGEAAPTEAQQTINRLKQDPACREVWDCFHMVGDVMRGEPLLHEDFMARLRQRIDAEPTVLAPPRRWRNAIDKALPIAASLAFVAIATGAIMYQNKLPQNMANAPNAGGEKLAQSFPSDSRSQPADAANASQVNEYLMAHQEFSPRTALQGVVPYVRSVSAPHDGNRR